jgi:hypothetical protein
MNKKITSTAVSFLSVANSRGRSAHRLHFKSYVQQFQHNALIGGYMVDDNKHSMAICPNDGKLQVIDSWNGMIYDLYDLPDKFIITSLTFIYDQNKL